MLKRGGQRQSEIETLVEGEAATAMQVEFEGARDVRVRSEEYGMRNGSRRIVGQFRILHSALRTRVVRQLHDIIKIASLVVAPDMENVHLAGVDAGDRLEF